MWGFLLLFVNSFPFFFVVSEKMYSFVTIIDVV